MYSMYMYTARCIFITCEHGRVYGYINLYRDNLQLIQVHSMTATNVNTTRWYLLCVGILLTDWSSEVPPHALQTHSTPLLLPQATSPYFCSPFPAKGSRSQALLPEASTSPSITKPEHQPPRLTALILCLLMLNKLKHLINDNSRNS